MTREGQGVATRPARTSLAQQPEVQARVPLSDGEKVPDVVRGRGQGSAMDTGGRPQRFLSPGDGALMTSQEAEEDWSTASRSLSKACCRSVMERSTPHSINRVSPQPQVSRPRGRPRRRGVARRTQVGSARQGPNEETKDDKEGTTAAQKKVTMVNPREPEQWPGQASPNQLV